MPVYDRILAPESYRGVDFDSQLDKDMRQALLQIMTGVPDEKECRIERLENDVRILHQEVIRLRRIVCKLELKSELKRVKDLVDRYDWDSYGDIVVAGGNV